MDNARTVADKLGGRIRSGRGPVHANAEFFQDRADPLKPERMRVEDNRSNGRKRRDGSLPPKVQRALRPTLGD